MKLIRNLVSSVTKGALIAGFGFSALAGSARADDSAVILLYHHVSDSTPASTSISPDQFKTHMTYLAENFNVMPLPDVVEALQQKKPLPPKTVAVTFDDGYRNILENGHPIMQSLSLPYTVFVNPDEIGRLGNQLTWDDVKKMHDDGVDFANHTLDHIHMLNKLPDESQSAWLKRVWGNVEEAEEKLESHIGESLKYLAYPFGEYNEELAEKLASNGYVGFGQHSGGVSSFSDFTALPRFPAAGRFASMEPIKVKMNSLGMPVTASGVDDPERTNPIIDETITLKIAGDDVRLSQAACYFQNEKLPIETGNGTLSYTLDTVLPTGRSRVNCTAPSNSKNRRYYWFSQPFFVSRQDGTYPD